jgi:hypothetical protein
MGSYLRLLLEKTMREIKEIVFCVTPFVVTAATMYLLGAFVCASWDVAEWERSDRAFFGITAVVFGFSLLFRLDYGRKYDQ